MDTIGRLGAWIVYFGVVGLVLTMGWREPLKNHFIRSDSAAEPQATQMDAPAPELTTPIAPATSAPQAANGQVEHTDSNVQGNRRRLIFSTPVP
jgi:hypothetical protein